MNLTKTMRSVSLCRAGTCVGAVLLSVAAHGQSDRVAPEA